MTAPWLKTGIQVAQNDRGANAHHHKQVSCRFEPSSPFYGRFSVQKMAVWGCFQDDRPEDSGRSPVCQVGVCNEGRCSSIAIGVSKERKSAFNKAGAMPWCQTVVHFEVKMGRFLAPIQENPPDCGSISAKQAAFPPQRFPMRYARLGPRSVIVRVLITERGLPSRGFTPPFRVQG